MITITLIYFNQSFNSNKIKKYRCQKYLMKLSMKCNNLTINLNKFLPMKIEVFIKKSCLILWCWSITTELQSYFSRYKPNHQNSTKKTKINSSNSFNYSPVHISTLKPLFKTVNYLSCSMISDVILWTLKH